MENCTNAMFHDQIAKTTSRIRFSYPDLYLQLKKLSSKMSFYQFKMTVIYWTSYLDEFEQSCLEFMETQTKQELNISELFKPQHYQSMCVVFQIPITSEIFFQKLGKYPETPKIFENLKFKPFPTAETPR